MNSAETEERKLSKKFKAIYSVFFILWGILLGYVIPDPPGETPLMDYALSFVCLLVVVTISMPTNFFLHCLFFLAGQVIGLSLNAPSFLIGTSLIGIFALIYILICGAMNIIAYTLARLLRSQISALFN